MPESTIPWRRVVTPETIPDPLTAAAVDGLDGEAFSRLIRDHLVPRTQIPTERANWERLWLLLGNDDDLAERALDVLERYLDQVEHALRDGQLSDQEAKRARKFREFCDASWNRIEGTTAQRPLSWAGRAGRGFTPVAERIIATLVDAIDQHRSAAGSAPASSADETLWASLADVGLDPAAVRRM